MFLIVLALVFATIIGATLFYVLFTVVDQLSAEVDDLTELLYELLERRA